MSTLLKIFGYKDMSALLHDSLHYGFTEKVMSVSMVCGALATIVEDILGLKPIILIAFCVLISLEFIIALKAKTYQGQKIRSIFWSQVVVKWFIYAVIIGLMNIMAKHLGQIDIWGVNINIYQWLYYSTVNIIIIQLFVSIFEKLSKLGFTESSKLFKVIKRKLDKWLELEDEPEIVDPIINSHAETGNN